MHIKHNSQFFHPTIFVEHITMLSNGISLLPATITEATHIIIKKVKRKGLI
jgi:hypothetical protein